MLTFLMISLISFFVISGVFLTIEARRRNQMGGAWAKSRTGGSKVPENSDQDSEVPKAA